MLNPDKETIVEAEGVFYFAFPRSELNNYDIPALVEYFGKFILWVYLDVAT